MVDRTLELDLLLHFFNKLINVAVEVRTIPVSALGEDHLDRWAELQASNPSLRSPYFCPEFTRAVDRARDGCYVSLLYEGDSLAGFFPFERGAFGVARPIGSRLSDYHGVVAAPDFTIDPVELLRGSGLTIWDFDHLIADQPTFRPFFKAEATSPILDLSDGFDSYCDRRRAMGSKKISQTNRKARKLERERGEIRFEADVDDARVLDLVIRGKQQQCRDTGVHDFFAEDWAVELVRQIHRTRSERFGGLLSALSLGDRVIAAHFGMRTPTTVHWWFPVYDHELSRYSPGTILLLRLAEHVAATGGQILDLGKGDDAYKNSFMTDEIPLAEGSVICPSVRGTLRKLRRSSESFLRRSPFAAPIRAPLRAGLRCLRSLHP